MLSDAFIAKVLNELDVPNHRWDVPVLIGTFGLPGAGKTEVAQWLARRLPVLMLSTDAIRLRYQLPSGPATHDVMYEIAAKLLPANISLLLDGIHMGRHDRQRLRQCADQYHAHSTLIYVTASPELIRTRLQRRERDPASIVAEGKFVITPEHFERIARYLQEPAHDEGIWWVDTSLDGIDQRLALLESELRQLTGLPEDCG